MTTYEQLRVQEEAEQIYEPWRERVREVGATLLEVRAFMDNAGIKYETGDLIELAKLSLAKEWGWPS